MRRKLKILTACFVTSIGFIAILYFFSNYENHKKNGFIRLFPPHQILPVKSIDLRFNSYYIAGITKSRIYLGNYSVKTLVFSADHNLNDTVTTVFSHQINDPSGQATSFRIDSPTIYFFDERIASVTRKNFPANKFQSYKILGNNIFSSCLVLSPNSYLIRFYSDSLKQNILRKVAYQANEVKYKDFKLDKYEEGYFSTDGILQREAEANRVVYLYHYKNSFVVLDTNLSVMVNGRTIDTVSVPKIKVEKVQSSGLTTFSSPPLLVNKRLATDKEHIYVNSQLTANNEASSIVSEFSIIDVYNLANGQYQFSFYISNLEGKKLTSFAVYDKTLVLLQDHFLAIYKINF